MRKYSNYLKILSCWLWFGLLACNLFAKSPTEIKPLSQLPVVPSPTVTTSAALPVQTTSEVSKTSEVIFAAAMRPTFAHDVATVAAMGVSRYSLTVRLTDFERADGLSLLGQEQILYTNREPVPLPEIYFRLYPNLPGYDGEMSVQQVLVAGQAVAFSLEAADTAVRVPLTRPLLPQHSLSLTLQYQAVIPTEVDDGYNIFSYTDGTVALANFYPVIPVYDTDGWSLDVPPVYGDATFLDVSLYQVSLTVPLSMVVVASGSLVGQASCLSTNDRQDACPTKTLNFSTGPMRDFYLAMRADYQISSEMVDGVMVNSYYPPNMAKGGKLALRYAADGLRLFQQKFGDYPYAEFDVVATPTEAGGVEYPGVVVIAQDLYRSEGGFFEHAVAHEVAHQWWYGLVGNNQVHDPWLDEALTNYSALLYWEKVHGTAVAEKIKEDYLLSDYQQAKKEGRDRPIAGAVADFSQNDYGTFVYGKGALFFEAMRQEVGDEAFFKIMQTYFTKYKYQTAYPADLLAVIEQVSGKAVEPLYEKWINGKE